MYAFWPGLENAGNRWYYRPGVSAGAIPTNDGDTCLFAATSAHRFQEEIRKDIKVGFRRVVAECSQDLARELGEATPEAVRFRGFPGHPGQMRQSYGPSTSMSKD